MRLSTGLKPSSLQPSWRHSWAGHTWSKHCFLRVSQACAPSWKRICPTARSVSWLCMTPSHSMGSSTVFRHKPNSCSSTAVVSAPSKSGANSNTQQFLFYRAFKHYCTRSFGHAIGVIAVTCRGSLDKLGGSSEMHIVCSCRPASVCAATRLRRLYSHVPLKRLMTFMQHQLLHWVQPAALP